MLMTSSTFLPTAQLQYHLYQPPVPSLSSHPSHLINASFFFSPTLREELQRRQGFSAQMPTHKLAAEGEIMPYWGILPLDRKLPGSGGPNDRAGRDTGVYGYRSWAYKVTSENDGKHYALRRIEGRFGGFEAFLNTALPMLTDSGSIRLPSEPGCSHCYG